VRNVYVLPGVPGLFREKFEAVASRVTGRAVATARVYTSERETEMAGRLATVAAAHPDVAIGSYPRWGKSDYSVIVTLESRDEAALAGAFEAVCAAVRVVSAEGPGA
jgi:molybdopterin-biosynthesis enzyme MoeA-like protein